MRFQAVELTAKLGSRFNLCDASGEDRGKPEELWDPHGHGEDLWDVTTPDKKEKKENEEQDEEELEARGSELFVLRTQLRRQLAQPAV